jgi:hypothetical protein
MNMESRLLSKVLDEKNISILHRANVTEQDFYTQLPAYKFEEEYKERKANMADFDATLLSKN